MMHFYYFHHDEFSLFQINSKIKTMNRKEYVVFTGSRLFPAAFFEYFCIEKLLGFRRRLDKWNA